MLQGKFEKNLLCLLSSGVENVMCGKCTSVSCLKLLTVYLKTLKSVKLLIKVVCH